MRAAVLLVLALAAGCGGSSTPAEEPVVESADFVTIEAPAGPVTAGTALEVRGRSGCSGPLTLVSVVVKGREYPLRTTSSSAAPDGRYDWTATGSVPDVPPQTAQVFANTTCGRPEDVGTASADLQITG